MLIVERSSAVLGMARDVTDLVAFNVTHTCNMYKM